LLDAATGALLSRWRDDEWIAYPEDGLLRLPVAFDVLFSPDGSLLAVGGGNGLIHVWSVPGLLKRPSPAPWTPPVDRPGRGREVKKLKRQNSLAVDPS
jgi:WD40 repeat protein